MLGTVHQIFPNREMGELDQMIMIDDYEVAADRHDVVCINFLVDFPIGVERRRLHKHLDTQWLPATHYPLQCSLCSSAILWLWRIHGVYLVINLVQFWPSGSRFKAFELSFEDIAALDIRF